MGFIKNDQLRENTLARVLASGLARHGDKLIRIVYDDEPWDVDDCEIVAFAGVKCREWYMYCKETRKPFLYFDKGYYYPKEKRANPNVKMLDCWRVSYNEQQPLEFLRTAKCGDKRWNRLGKKPSPWRDRTADGPIVIAGSSWKYHLFKGLGDPTLWAQSIVDELRRYTDRPIWYRPKPSWRDAVPIEGTEFQTTGNFDSVVKTAHAVVTHGSNASLIAMLVGVPSVITGDGIMAPISSTSLSEIEEPYLATDEERCQLLWNLAWSQFTNHEFATGEAWAHIKRLYLK